MPRSKNDGLDLLNELFSGMFDPEESERARSMPRPTLKEYDPITSEDFNGLGDIADTVYAVEVIGMTLVGMVLYTCIM